MSLYHNNIHTFILALCMFFNFLELIFNLHEINDDTIKDKAKKFNIVFAVINVLTIITLCNVF